MPQDANGNDPGNGGGGEAQGGFEQVDDFSDIPLAVDNSDPINTTGINGCPLVSVCTGDHSNNIFWREGAPGYPGQCILDSMDFEQLFVVLQRVPQAAEHLRRITSDQRLLKFANEVPLADSELADDQKAADLINKGRGNTGTLPFYTVLRGNSDGTIR